VRQEITIGLRLRREHRGQNYGTADSAPTSPVAVDLVILQNRPVRLAVCLTAVLDPINMDLPGLIVHCVEDTPIPNPQAIALWDVMKLAHTRRPWVLPELLELLHDPLGYGWIELPDLPVGRGLDDQSVHLRVFPSELAFSLELLNQFL
jgi:hypothetical protein